MIMKRITLEVGTEMIEVSKTQLNRAIRKLLEKYLKVKVICEAPDLKMTFVHVYTHELDGSYACERFQIPVR